MQVFHLVIRIHCSGALLFDGVPSWVLGVVCVVHVCGFCNKYDVCEL